MKYLAETMTVEEAKKAYRTLAKTMHPDVGGDEEEFKILAAEFAAISNNSVRVAIQSIDDLVAASGVMANAIVSVLQEIYPRTKVVLNYSYNSIDVDIYGNVPFQKMLHIEEIIKSFKYNLRITISFQRGEPPKWFKLATEGKTTWINMKQGDSADMTNAKILYTGRRYTVEQSRYYTHCFDAKEGRDIYMKRTNKFTLQELMGI